MLFIYNEENLFKEKTRFFNMHMDFINQYMPNNIKNYVTSFLSNDITFSFKIQDIDPQTLDDSVPDHALFYCVIYVCCRGMNIYWSDFFQYIRSFSDELPIDFSSSFLFSNTKTHQSKFYTIRQCRVDKPLYTTAVNMNVGFFNKNENFYYQCYNDQQARQYLQYNCSSQALTAYNNIQYPQAKSDFFLMASLYTDGGISADVCSVAQTNLEILIKDTEFLLIYDEEGIHKKFVFSSVQNPFILYHLNFLIEKMNHFGADQDYDNIFSRSAFHRNFLDFYAFHYQDIQNIRLTFLHNNIYTAFVRDEIVEENLSNYNSFPSVVAKGAFKKEKLILPTKMSGALEASTKNFYMPATRNLTIIGQDNNPHFFNRVNTPYALSSLDVWAVDNVDLAGIGWLWKNNDYINLESHLPDLAYNTDWRKNYLKPAPNNITKVIEDECIVVVTAGYTCYGHYLVDDLPRIGLIKEYLGDDFYNKKFIIPLLMPEWAKKMLKFFFNLDDEHFLTFDENVDVWKLKKVFIASFPSKDNYNFHSYIREFYKPFCSTDVVPYRKVCLSRKLMNPNVRHQRVFRTREVFEYLAESYGFDVLCPETLSIEEQIQLMSETVCQIGEHGSAQHSSVFNPEGMIIGTLNPIGDIQIALGRIYNDTNIVCYSDHFEWGGPNNDVLYYDIEHEKLMEFLDKVTEYER